MSVIGPRPALWNQDVLIAEREKYNANDVKPGLTGWAQINGRDELEIPVKAKLEKQGHEVRIAYGRETVPEQFQKYAVRIGTDLDVKLHGIKARLFDRAGEI